VKDTVMLAAGDQVRLRVSWGGYPAGTEGVVVATIASIGRTLFEVELVDDDGRHHHLRGIREIDLEPLDERTLSSEP
jgi:hypothetical protein